MQTGKIKFFNAIKGYGFIIPDNGEADIFFHVKACAEIDIDAKQVKNKPCKYKTGLSKKNRIEALEVVILN